MAVADHRPSEVGHEEELRALAVTLSLRRVSIEGPVYGDGKIAVMRAADVFVLPSLNENFAITVAEALAVGTPVIATKGSPWSGLETEGCGWWVDHGVDPLTAALTISMSMPRAALKAIGAKGQAWMMRDFSWTRVARDMLGMYRWAARSFASAAGIRAKLITQRQAFCCAFALHVDRLTPAHHGNSRPLPLSDISTLIARATRARAIFMPCNPAPGQLAG